MPESETASAPKERAARNRIGLAVSGPDAAAAIRNIVAAEAAGVHQVWMTQTPSAPDTLTLFAAAATQTANVRLGTAIVPTYPRHPLVLVQQALALGDLAPERLRLGVGPSHRPTIEGVYGLPMPSPLEHLREYVTVLRAALWEGRINFQGTYFHIEATTFPRPPRTPILISALREGAFHLAGEVADGAISWLCPVRYLIERALPALRAGAAMSGRPVPPLVAHVPVAMGENPEAVLAAARRRIGGYGRMPFYAHMFADAGFPVASDGALSDALLEDLVVFGDDTAVKARLSELLTQGLDELLVMPVPVTQPEEELARLMRLVGEF